ncbi:thymocyte nuclear protein [Plectosphaerella cucumerina]|uniref:Thymocyte nuclear protein 1 n=1 Tax=Plectosphaerella cucumerina TaxID=40658 RepID=A0A8K0TT02_9PEZI|nr:thymocyte nuclear protein [Plectosphaerella cucumerina]
MARVTRSQAKTAPADTAEASVETRAPKTGKRAREAKESDDTEPPKKRSAKSKPEPAAKQKPASTTKEPKAKKVAVASKSASELAALREQDVPALNPEASPRPASEANMCWLLKSEPEVRIEDGYEIKFSIDDLAAKTKPEGWDGIRSYAARNNLRAMRKGDKAFFYHSNCKEPGVVGIMSIVREWSPDWNACINDNPYYDASAPHDGSKWSLVHVKLEHKFPHIVTLKSLRDAPANGPLGSMQLLKQSRLSVTKVTPDEWDEVVRMARALATEEEWEKSVEDSKKLPNYAAV